MNYTEIAEKHGAIVWNDGDGVTDVEFTAAQFTAYSKEIERLALERAMELCTSTYPGFDEDNLYPCFDTPKECADAIRKLIEELEE